MTPSTSYTGGGQAVRRTKIVMTYDLAMAASRDEGNRSMRKAGRTKWNVDDWNAACDALDRYYPQEQRASEGLKALRAVLDGETGRCVYCGQAVRIADADDHVASECPEAA